MPKRNKYPCRGTVAWFMTRNGSPGSMVYSCDAHLGAVLTQNFEELLNLYRQPPRVYPMPDRFGGISCYWQPVLEREESDEEGDRYRCPCGCGLWVLRGYSLDELITKANAAGEVLDYSGLPGHPAKEVTVTADA